MTLSSFIHSQGNLEVPQLRAGTGRNDRNNHRNRQESQEWAGSCASPPQIQEFHVSEWWELWDESWEFRKAFVGLPATKTLGLAITGTLKLIILWEEINPLERNSWL